MCGTSWNTPLRQWHRQLRLPVSQQTFQGEVGMTTWKNGTLYHYQSISIHIYPYQSMSYHRVSSHQFMSSIFQDQLSALRCHACAPPNIALNSDHVRISKCRKRINVKCWHFETYSFPKETIFKRIMSACQNDFQNVTWWCDVWHFHVFPGSKSFMSECSYPTTQILTKDQKASPFPLFYCRLRGLKIKKYVNIRRLNKLQFGLSLS